MQCSCGGKGRNLDPSPCCTCFVDMAILNSLCNSLAIYDLIGLQCTGVNDHMSMLAFLHASTAQCYLFPHRSGIYSWLTMTVTYKNVMSASATVTLAAVPIQQTLRWLLSHDGRISVKIVSDICGSVSQVGMLKKAVKSYWSELLCCKHTMTKIHTAWQHIIPASATPPLLPGHSQTSPKAC